MIFMIDIAQYGAKSRPELPFDKSALQGRQASCETGR